MPSSKESREELGRALTAAREEAGITVVQLAQQANPGRAGGLSRYYDAEAGRRMATSETVEHYAKVLERPDLHDIRNKILSKKPASITQPARSGDRSAIPDDETQSPTPIPSTASNGLRNAATQRVSSTDRKSAELGPSSLGDAWPRPELLPETLRLPVSELVAQLPPLDNGTVVRGREAVLAAACALMEEAVEICSEGKSVSAQIIQLNPERTFTRNLGSGRPHASRFFPYQIQRLVEAGGSVRHLLAYEIMHRVDMWSAFERFVALMELAGDYSVYWPSQHESNVRMPDYLVIENVAALEVLPTGPLTSSGDVAVIHRDVGEVLSVMKDYGENLIAESDEAFHVIDPSSNLAIEQARVWVDQAIVEAEQVDAPRFLIKHGLSTVTEPLKSYESRTLAKHRLTPDDRAAWPPWVKQDLELRRRRLANFLRHIEDHRAIDLVPLSSLRHFVDHGKYSEPCTEFGDFTVPIEARIQQLEDVITLVSTNQLYDLVVLEDDPPLDQLIGAGLLMMGHPDDSDWSIFYESRKPDGPGGALISVAFEAKLDMFRQPVGNRIASLEALADKTATQNTLRLLRGFIGELKAKL